MGGVLESDPPPADGSAFPVTRWTMISMARGEDDAAARHALEELCGAYWYPLYGFARRRGLSPADAEDAVQAFFLHLMRHDALVRADRGRGRLRSFLLEGMSNLLTQQWRKENALKRGGGVKPMRIDRDWAEERLAHDIRGEDEAADFDREWVCALLDRVFERLRRYHQSRGRQQVFERLKGCLLGDATYGDEQEISAELGLSGPGVRSAVFQLRQRFRRYVEDEIRDTVGSEADMRDELVHLCRVLSEQRAETMSAKADTQGQPPAPR